LIARRMAGGDLAEVPRRIDHCLIVSKKHLPAIARDLQQAGFEVHGGTRGLRRAWLDFSREDPATAEAAASFVREIVTIANRYGAKYDGWGSFLVEEPPAG
jgi:regulator of RNase E activity RraB